MTGTQGDLHQLDRVRNPHTQQWVCACGWRGTEHPYGDRTAQYSQQAIRHIIDTQPADQDT
jgi:hypothetical protein